MLAFNNLHGWLQPTRTQASPAPVIFFHFFCWRIWPRWARLLRELVPPQTFVVACLHHVSDASSCSLVSLCLAACMVCLLISVYSLSRLTDRGSASLLSGNASSQLFPMTLSELTLRWSLPPASCLLGTGGASNTAVAMTPMAPRVSKSSSVWMAWQQPKQKREASAKSPQSLLSARNSSVCGLYTGHVNHTLFLASLSLAWIVDKKRRESRNSSLCVPVCV